ncbi:hypothetical protein PENSPDRAFT_646960 [Peniophora sp. CONT]|nr:hypothetical protein PENSPDRAFT_646960 [Peniophora sp. CONT]
MVLRIENEIMTVYTRWLKKKSQLFRGIVESNQSAPNDQENPLAVPDVTVAQFGALLDYIDNSTSSNFAMPATRWADLLAASHHLKIASIKQRVVREVFHNHRGSF